MTAALTILSELWSKHLSHFLSCTVVSECFFKNCDGCFTRGLVDQPSCTCYSREHKKLRFKVDEVLIMDRRYEDNEQMLYTALKVMNMD